MSIRSANSSNIELSPDTRVFDLQLSILGSRFSDNGASIDTLRIDADKISSLTLNGDNLKKINLMGRH